MGRIWEPCFEDNLSTKCSLKASKHMNMNIITISYNWAALDSYETAPNFAQYYDFNIYALAMIIKIYIFIHYITLS